MVWLKQSDTSATHPVTMRGGIGGDDRQLNEVFGFVLRCAVLSSAHLTDYFVDEATAMMLGGQHTRRLANAAKKAGYWTSARRSGHRGWLLVQDEDLFHIRLRDEVEWEKQQKADNSNPALTVPVRLRDGDACRYCGDIVQWRARKGNRRGTYDHLRPKEKATSPDDLVVACGGCNAGRGDDPHANERYPLLAPPTTPFYGDLTVTFLRQHGRHVTPSVTRPDDQSDTASAPKRPRSRRDTAPASGTTSRTRPGGQPDNATGSDPAAGGTPRSPRRNTPAKARAPTRSADSAEIQPTESGFAGSGRERAGSGHGSGHGSGGAVGRRGRRGRPRPAGVGGDEFAGLTERPGLTDVEAAELAYPNRPPPPAEESTA